MTPEEKYKQTLRHIDAYFSVGNPLINKKY